MIEIIEKTICQHGLFSAASPVILMVSGGSDSTALAYIMKDLSERGLVGPVAILHVNHKLRGQEAEDDQVFVSKLADLLGLPFYACEVDVAQAARLSGGNIEAVGRQERYVAAHEALESLCLHFSIPLSEGRIVTAHTQDDRVENFYMRSIKGTGPGGFRSMLYQNGAVVRPFLDVSRIQLRDYLFSRESMGLAVLKDEQGQLWREDATNAHTDRFRAYVRHEIIPLCKAQNSQLLDTLTRIMNLIADEDDFMNELAQDLLDMTVQWQDDKGVPLNQEVSTQEADRCLILPAFGKAALPLRRRVLKLVLSQLQGSESRIETSVIEQVLEAFDDTGAPKSGFVVNIQGDLAVSANKRGVLIEPMAAFRSRRKNVE